MLTAAAVFAVAAACPGTAVAKDAPQLDLKAMALTAEDLPSGTTVRERRSSGAGLHFLTRRFDLHGATLGRARVDTIMEMMTTGEGVPDLLTSEVGVLDSSFGRRLFRGIFSDGGWHVTLGRPVGLGVGDASTAVAIRMARHGTTERDVWAVMGEGAAEATFIITGTRGSRLGVVDVLPLLRHAADKVHAGLLPHVTAPPAIGGTPRAGETLTSSTGTWAEATKPVAYSYQWSRCDAGGNACQPIAGATGPTYPVASADVGLTLRVTVTAADDYGTAAADSAPVAVT
jgi:hypothetical protein